MAPAFVAASPPLRSASLAGARPASAGVTSNTLTLPSFSSATVVAPVVVSSSRPSWPCTTHTCSAPRFFNTCAIGSTHSSENTPSTCRVTLAGFEIGPSRLKIVRMPSSARIGAQCFIDGWYIGAQRKPTPASLIAFATVSGLASTLTPSSVRTSDAPERDETRRLPCFATFSPAPAATMDDAVDTLNVPWLSPPVPTMSTAPAGAVMRFILARIIWAAPVISSTVSPRTRSAMRNAPICAGEA